jgi:lipopolysaccharide transport system ATP-binding protein
MSEEALVCVDAVSKKFCRSLKRSLWYGVQDIAADLNPFGKHQIAAVDGKSGARQLRPQEFWAVDDVSFELRRGETLGLLGLNGAGKTTLLKMINGLSKPDRGRIEMRGRVGALIALGAGFNPILTGRENIYVNGSVLGLSKREIDGKLEEIVEFAELSEFIDTAVQNYSSGMQVRLGFAVATALDPDILLLDEVLAVGDARFRAKCYNRIGALQDRAAVIFVSHGMDQVARVCSSGLYMERGRSRGKVTATEAIAMYEQTNSVGEDNGAFCHVSPPVTKAEVRIEKNELKWGQDLHISLAIETDQPIEQPQISGVVYDAPGNVVASYVVRLGATRMSRQAGTHAVRLSLLRLELASGKYFLGLNLFSGSNITHLVWSYKETSFFVEQSPPGATSHRLTVSAQEIETAPRDAKHVIRQKQEAR